MLRVGRWMLVPACLIALVASILSPLAHSASDLPIARTGVQPVTPVQADWPLPNGHFFTQTGGGTGRGYAITDDGGIRFWSEFQRLGGVDAVGYPASQRFEWDGFTVQVFQRAVFQWRPEVQQVYFVNVFDLLDQRGHNDWLRTVRQTPPPQQWAEDGLTWDEIVRRRLAVLDASPELHAAYFAAVGDPVQANGLPTTDIVDQGNHFVLRAQRVVFQLWKEDVPWARRGTVTVGLGGDIAKEAGILPNPAALQPIAPPEAPAPGQPAGRWVLGYYVPYDLTSWYSLQEHADALDYVGAQWVSIDPCGNIGSRDNQTLNAFARARGIGVLPSLLTASAWLNRRILTDEATAAHAVDQIVEYVVDEGYPGFDLDLEGIDANDRAAYTRFVARLGAALRERGKILHLAIPAKTRDVTTGWAGAYDYAALGQHADRITIMTYGYHGSFGGPGSIAPYDWVDQVIAFATSQIPPEKVLVGIAFYGYDWNVTSGWPTRALLYSQAQWLAERYQVPIRFDPATQTATFRYQAPAGDPLPPRPELPPVQHQITERRPGPCSVAPPPGGPTPTPRPTPPPSAIQEHEVWIEDSASAAARLRIVDRHGTGGIATWRLGQEDSRVWPIIQDWRD